MQLPGMLWHQHAADRVCRCSDTCMLALLAAPAHKCTLPMSPMRSAHMQRVLPAARGLGLHAHLRCVWPGRRAASGAGARGPHRAAVHGAGGKGTGRGGLQVPVLACAALCCRKPCAWEADALVLPPKSQASRSAAAAGALVLRVSPLTADGPAAHVHSWTALKPVLLPLPQLLVFIMHA